MDSGPLKHARNLSEFFRQYGVQEVTGEELAARIQPVALVDDATGLSQPLRPAVGVLHLATTAPGAGNTKAVRLSSGTRGAFVAFQSAWADWRYASSSFFAAAGAPFVDTGGLVGASWAIDLASSGGQRVSDIAKHGFTWAVGEVTGGPQGPYNPLDFISPEFFLPPGSDLVVAYSGINNALNGQVFVSIPDGS